MGEDRQSGARRTGQIPEPVQQTAQVCARWICHLKCLQAIDPSYSVLVPLPVQSSSVESNSRTKTDGKAAVKEDTMAAPSKIYNPNIEIAAIL